MVQSIVGSASYYYPCKTFSHILFPLFRLVRVDEHFLYLRRPDLYITALQLASFEQSARAAEEEE